MRMTVNTPQQSFLLYCLYPAGSIEFNSEARHAAFHVSNLALWPLPLLSQSTTTRSSFQSVDVAQVFHLQLLGE